MKYVCVCALQNLDQWTMRQSSLELQLMIKQTASNVSFCSEGIIQGRVKWLFVSWWGGGLAEVGIGRK